MTTAATLEMPTENLQPAQKPAPATALSPKTDRIVLTGFMGSGKTSAGRLLAAELGWNFVDLDTEIERRDGRTVPQIFAAGGEKEGEAHFRHLESAALASLLGRRSIVLALGGGAPEELGNRLLLEQTPRTAVVYLSAPLELLLDRCHTQAADPTATARPVLADLTAATARHAHRRPIYERIAAHHIDTSTLTLDATVQAILNALSS